MANFVAWVMDEAISGLTWGLDARGMRYGSDSLDDGLDRVVD